jgi:arylformamidase
VRPTSLDYQAEYNNRARVPEHPQIIAEWERDAAAYRVAWAERSQLGLRYGDHSRQTIDIFEPDALDPNRPLVLVVHGGYWRSLHPSMFSHWAAGANAHGYPVAVAGYRLCPEVGIADIIADVRAAALFLYRTFQKPLVVCGHSAGAHLASTLVAADWQSVGVRCDFIRKGVGVSGVFDLAPLIETEMNVELRLEADSARAVSPAYWPVPTGIRFEAWVGDDESSEFLRQSRLIAERWGAANADMRLEIIPNANHFTAPNGLSDPNSALVAALVGIAAAR